MTTMRNHSTIFSSILGAAVLLGPVAACAAEPKLRPAAVDPSNPAAPEATATATATDAKPVPSSKGDQPAATLYTCPMHPEVISDKPGRCPKCGMKLVPKEPPAGKK